MDKREIKTKRNIKNAFLKLRSKYDIEHITIKDIAEEAEISKATFYLHYKDIYDLSDTLGKELIENLLRGISDPENYLNDTVKFTKELANAFLAQRNIISIIFSGSQKYKLADNIEKGIKDFILEQHPEYIDNVSFNLQLSYHIKGFYYAFIDNLDQFAANILIDELSRLISVDATRLKRSDQ